MLKKKYNILICDDEKDIVDVLNYNLSKEGFNVTVAFNGHDALQKIHPEIDLVLLDIMMPFMDGLEVCKKIKENPQMKNISIIFLTAKDSEIDEIKGLELGADDYITKPISIKKLLTRIKTILRRSEKIEQKNLIEIRGIKVDLDNYEIQIGEKRIFLPRKEFETFVFLAKHAGKIVRREQLLEKVWGDDTVVTPRTIDVHIRKIREKLGEKANLIETIKGVGYRLKRSDV